ncbi:hypothetical protein tinsulaeT_02350 [Thalassotalea insulae]|uniref:Swiss Army Knife 2H phosphoesterase domain-containing protein n=1 Tax=Thalassotalea insulae TaxID=2056778 RepID=A0ABQ6GQC0_9GAMM|nr:hypothetical protein [Thalassotalea insulae]GLX76895.1 hypothetical protein tinsulaeT_02350 [Thalassotalea insulae]
MIKNIINFLLIGILSCHVNTTFANSIAEYLVEPDSSIVDEAEDEEQQVTVRPGHARALAELANEKYQDIDFKPLLITVKRLTDNKGLTYLAGVIERADVVQYLKQMQLILGDDYKRYRQHQAARDHDSFHLTLVNPYEYQALTDKTSMINQRIRIQLHGLGRVSQGKNTSYFVVASSSDGQFLRQNLLLAKKDFHVTLGFSLHDIHGVAKNKQTLIK